MKGFPHMGIMILVFTTLIIACKKSGVPEDEGPAPIVLAQVFEDKLFYDDIKDLLQGFTSKEDSIQQVRSLTEHWVRDRLVLVEAEKNLPKDVNMNKLLEDYRQSLLRHFFEQRVMRERLDTVIVEEDLLQYYEENKDQHRLQSGILRTYFFKIKKPLARSDKILQWWKAFPEKNFENVLDYASQNARTNWSDTSKWHEMQMVIQLFPEGTLSASAIRSNRSVVREDRDYIYLLYPLEVYQEHDIAPLVRVREQAARFILHQRELELLDTIKQEIYDRDILNEKVRIYTQ